MKFFTGLKRKAGRMTGIPTTRSGRSRKFGGFGCLLVCLVIMLAIILFILGCDQARWEDTVADVAESLDGVKKSKNYVQDLEWLRLDKAILELNITQLEWVVEEIEEEQAYDGDEEVAMIYVTALGLIDESRELLRVCEEEMALCSAAELDAIHNPESPCLTSP